jgi:hypothetical protein
MKRLLSILLLGFLTLSVRAQDISTSEQTLEFYYIAHDRTSPVGKICDFIKERQKEATYYKDLAMIFYMANGDAPMIVRMNLPGDNREDFQDIINALQQQMSHDINPRDDVRLISQLFNDVDFAYDDRNPRFRSFQWVSFITPLFWQMQYNEDVIAALYFILELDTLPEDYLTMDIYYDSKESLEYNSEIPFGLKDMCGPCNILPLL